MANSLEIKLNDVRDDGVTIRCDLADAQVRELLSKSEVEVGAEQAGGSLDVFIYRAGDVFFLRGTMAGRFFVPCSRCLEREALVEMTEEGLSLTFIPQSYAVELEKDDVQLSLDDLDTFMHDGEVIDIASIMREYLVLALPIASVCDDACDGGANNLVEQVEESSGGEAPWKDALAKLK